ncbi:type II secretion system protein [Candidatus Saccharibacteria bacterium]|nr:type II secretion system protein [Candidatus Saccharibacteria bacterium]
MKKHLRPAESGFTIIEVVIVLAIAGLIMLIVFLAVPQLQRNSRDQARRAILSRIKAEIENYASNSGGTYPFTATCTGSGTTGEWCDLYNRYLTTIDIKDPSGSNVISASPSNSNANAAGGYLGGIPGTLVNTKGILDVITSAKCSGENVIASTGVNSYALVIGLDRANTRYCVDNG